MGRVLNRFSSDVACVDDSLPFILNILLANTAGLLGLLAVLGSGLPWLLLLLPPLSVIYYRVQRHYRASSRELRRLGSLTLSPLYTHLADTLAGLPVLRASGATDRCVGCASPSQSKGHEVLGGGGFRSPEKGRVGEGAKGKRKETEERDIEAEHTVCSFVQRGQCTKEHTDLSVPSGKACGCVDQLQEGGVLWGGLGESLQQWSGLTSLLASPRFEEENQRLLELNQRCQFASSATMQWLDIRLQLMGAAVVSAIAGIALVQHQQGLADPGNSPGTFTLASEVCNSHP